MNLTLEPSNLQRLNSLCGPLDQHIKHIEQYFSITIQHHHNQFSLAGDEQSCALAATLLQNLYQKTLKGKELSFEQVQLALVTTGQKKMTDKLIQFQTQTGFTIKPRTPTQNDYLQALNKYDVNFGIGPAGTGKTFLAVAKAVQALEQSEIERIILVRPAVEAGEKLGFLLGDLSEKVDPYLRPLYDALFDFIGSSKVARLIERDVIEIAPLAYMRGRTLNDAFIILDEGQNTTTEQMKMFLTRIGFSSKAVITGDITQIDLPKHIESGLTHALTVLSDIEDIGTTHFQAEDVVRHPLVKKIVNAYQTHDHA